MSETIRCFQCTFYKETASKRKSGWCQDTREGRKKIRVNAVDHCDNAVPIENKEG